MTVSGQGGIQIAIRSPFCSPWDLKTFDTSMMVSNKLEFKICYDVFIQPARIR